MQREMADYRSTCGETLAVVLAMGPEALFELRSISDPHNRSMVCATVDAACWAQTAFVFVVTSPSVSQEVTRLVHLVKRSKHVPVVQVVECGDEPLAATRDGSDFSVLRELVNASPVDVDSVLVVEADHPLVTSEQVYELCAGKGSAAGEGGSAPDSGLPYLMSVERLGVSGR